MTYTTRMPLNSLFGFNSSMADLARLSRLLSTPSQVDRFAGVFPPLNVSEDSDNYYVRAEIPGVAADAIEVSLVGRTLTLTGARAESVAEKVSYHRRERNHGTFKRSLMLPGATDPEAVEATFDEGILTVVLPKPLAAKPRTIQVRTLSDVE